MFLPNNPFLPGRRSTIVRWAVLTSLMLGLLPSGPLHAQSGAGMKGNMSGMSDTKGARTGTGTGTVTAVNAGSRKITFDHGPIPEIDWPAMKMEFSVASGVDLSKVKVGDKLRFTLSGSGNSYTVKSITTAP